MATIRLSPEQVESLGGEIKGMAQSVNDLLVEIKANVQTIDAGWEGLGNDAFMASYTQMEATLKSFPEVVEGVGEQVIAGARTWGDLEQSLGKQS